MFICANDKEKSRLLRGFMRAAFVLDKTCIAIIAVASVMVVAMLTGTPQFEVIAGIGAICAMVGVKIGQQIEKAKQEIP